MPRAARSYEGVVQVGAPLDRCRAAVATLAGIRGWWSPVTTGSPQPDQELHVGFTGLEETITLAVVGSGPSGVEWLVREHSAADDWAGSRISVRWEPRASGCQVALRHTGVDPRLVTPGWEHFLESLRWWAETGEGRPYPWPRPDARQLALRYHEAWTGRRFDEAVALLAEDLATEVPLHTYSSRDEWARALVGFGGLVDRVGLVSAVGSEREAVLIYDLHTPAYGDLRVAEHFTVADGAIVRIRHVHDTVALR